MAHDEDRHFDAEDVRVMAGLAGFSAAALHLSSARQARIWSAIDSPSCTPSVSAAPSGTSASELASAASKVAVRVGNRAARTRWAAAAAAAVADAFGWDDGVT